MGQCQDRTWYLSMLSSVPPTLNSKVLRLPSLQAALHETEEEHARLDSRLAAAARLGRMVREQDELEEAQARTKELLQQLAQLVGYESRSQAQEKVSV